MNTWLIIALALYSLGITIILLVAWNEGRPARKFIRSIEKAHKEREHVKTSKRRHDGGAYRRCKTMIAAHAKAGKDRSKAGKRKKGKK